MIRSTLVLIFSILILAIVSGCPQKTLAPGDEAIMPTDESDLLFQQAERLFQQAEPDQALALFNQYLARYPQGRYTDLALYRMGLIYYWQGQADVSRAFFERLATEYPQSAQANDALLWMVDLLSAEGRYAEALQIAVGMNEKQLDESMRHELWRRMARLYDQLQDPGNTALYAYRLSKALPEPEKERWAILFKQSLARLSGPDIEIIWDHLEDPQLRSQLMYQYALSQVAEEKYDDALELLIAFLSIYPDHPQASEAFGLVQALYQRLSFEPYTIGCLLPLSGSYQLYGQRALQGVELAMSMIQGGETGVPIRLVIKDTASQDSTAVQAVKELADDRVGVIIGPIATASAAAREAQKLHIPMITLTQKPAVTEIGDFIFRNFITPQNQAHALVDYFVNQIGLRDFAVLYPQEAYGETFMNYFWDEVTLQGGHIMGVESYESAQTDFKEVIGKLVGTFYELPPDLKKPAVVRVQEPAYFENPYRSGQIVETLLPDPVSRLTGLFFEDPDQLRTRGPAIGRSSQEKTERPIVDFDVLFVPDSPKMAALILPQLAYYDVRDIYLAGTNLWHSQQLVELTRDYAQNAVMVDGFFKDSASDQVRGFVESYGNIYGSEPGIVEAFAFDTASLIFQLMAHPGLTMRHLVRDAIFQTYDFKGVTGPTGFSQDGEATKQLSLLRLRASQFVEVTLQ